MIRVLLSDMFLSVIINNFDSYLAAIFIVFSLLEEKDDLEFQPFLARLNYAMLVILG